MQNFNTFNAKAVNTTAYAKLVTNKLTNTQRLVVAFNVTQRNANNNLLFPPQSKCAYVSGDLYTQAHVQQQLQRAKQILNTNNIILV